jgi:hypothetical protein
MAPALAQGTLSGTLYADEVQGTVIIACLLDAELGCALEHSPFTVIEHSGTRANYHLEAVAGQYLLLAWQDLNGNGELDEDGSDRLGFYLDAAGEPALISPPAANLDIDLTSNSALPSQPTNPATSSPPAQPTSPLGDLVGIWQMTRASGGDYRNLATGFSFSMTSGFSTLLKIRADGSYLMQFYASGVASNCAMTTYFENSAGTVTYQGNQLMLHPQWHTLEVEDCNPQTAARVELGTDMIVYTFRLEETFNFGMRSARLALEGGSVPLEYTLLHRQPRIPGYQPPQPADFIAGNNPAYQEIIGLWTPSPDSDTSFYNPHTGDFYFPNLNGARHQYLRFYPDGSYELANSWQNANYGGVCKVDYIYYERGMPYFAAEIAGERGGSGDVRFVASDARLIANIRNCGEDDGVLRYDLGPQVSYYYWSYSAADDSYWPTPETFSLKCEWELSEWQFFVCDGSSWATFGRR